MNTSHIPHGSPSLQEPPDRRKERDAAAIRLLGRMRQAARDSENPSTAELQEERVYGLRPVNRLGDLINGKYNGTRYDIERIYCGHGVYRWRLHEPARPGYPKDKRQNALPLDDHDWHRKATGKERPAPQPEAAGPLFAEVGR